MAHKVFNVDAAISYIKRYTNAIIYGKSGIEFENGADTSIFFCKAPPNSSGLYLVEMVKDDNSLLGSIIFSLTTGKTWNTPSVTILAISPDFVDKGELVVSKNFEKDDDTSNSYVGLTIPFEGKIKLTFQVILSNRGTIVPLNKVQKVTSSFTSYPVKNGYLLNKSIFSGLDEFNAFHKWSETHYYKPNDPVFYGQHLYYANPNNPPQVGESPVTASAKWIELATAEIPDTDISKGAYTPQLFYDKSLVISNDNAIGLRKAHRDVGYAYPSDKAEVYHFDGDLLNQDQANPITVDGVGKFIKKTDTNLEIQPHQIMDFKPFKEVPQFYYGDVSYTKDTKIKSEHNCISFWFKYRDEFTSFGKDTVLLEIKRPGELIKLVYKPSPTPYLAYAKGTPSYIKLDDNPTYWKTRSNDGWSENYSEGLVLSHQLGNNVQKTKVFENTLPIKDSWGHLMVCIKNESVTLFFRGKSETITKMSSDLESNPLTQIVINPSKKFMAVDELFIDPSSEVPFSRYKEISENPFPWAAHEKKDNWLVIHAQDLNKFDTNIFDSPLFKKKVKEAMQP